MKMMMRIPLVLALALMSAACGPRASTLPNELSIDALRARAEANPRDAAAQRALAVGELFQGDGDPLRARGAIERALALGPNDAALHLMSGIELYFHGTPEAAVEEMLVAIELAAQQGDHVVAEVAAGGLRELSDASPNFPERVEARLRATLPNLPVSARHPAASLLIDLAYRRGDASEVDAIAEDAGCVREWRVAGPIGPRDLLGFDDEHPIGGVGVMPESVDLGVGRGTRPVRAMEARGCAIHLGEGPVNEGGVTYAESFVDVPGGDYTLRIETPNSVEVHIDGEQLVRLDHRRQPLERSTFHAVSLSPGRHEISVKVATRHPNPILSVSLLPSSPSTALPSGAHLACYQRAAMALGRGQTIRARSALRSDECEDAPVILALRSAVALSDPYLPGDMGRDQARRLLRQVEARDPQAWFARLQLARLDAAEGRDAEAIAALRAYIGAWPEVPGFRMALIELLLNRGWDTDAEQQIEAAVAQMPGNCAPIEAALNHARRRDRIERIDRYADELMACNARSSARFALLVSARRWDDAETELERLLALEPPQARSRYLASRLDIAEGRANGAEIDAVIAALLESRPRSVSVALGAADRRLAEGDLDGARALLDAALRAEPAANGELHRIRAALGGRDELVAFRIDGAAAIAEFEANDATSYDQPQLLLLDYTAVRVFEDASQLVLTHQIYKALSEESVDDLGQFSPPEGGYVLTLHTIKADGTRLEPDLIDCTDEINLPTVAVGDYVEMETVRVVDPPVGIPGGILGDRFYFANVETPFHRSELVVATPPGFEISVDPRGDAPRMQRSTMQVHGSELTVARWRVDASQPLVFEPGSVDSREYIPSINWGVGARWPAFFEGLRDVLIDRDPIDPVAVDLARSIIQGADNERQQAERLFSWVLLNVENNNDVFGVAPRMLSSRAGNRSRVLYYLMGLVGIDAELVLVRGWNNDQTRSDVADEDTYPNLFVRYGDTLLMTGARGIPFGYASPMVRGQDGVVLVPFESSDEVRAITVPPAPEGSDRHVIELLADLGEGGAASVSVTETLRGSDAITWRENLENIPAAALNERFEQAYVSSILPGASLRSLRITGTGDTSAPLVLHYELTMPNLTRQQGSEEILPALFPAQLGANFASQAARTTTQLVGPPVDLEIILTLRHPGRATPIEAVELVGPGGARFEMSVDAAEGTTTITRKLLVPMMRVEPNAYPAFAAWAREVDGAEARELRLP